MAYRANFPIGPCETEAMAIIEALSIKHGTKGMVPTLSETDQKWLEDAALRGVNAGYFWKDRPVIETAEMKEIWEVSKPIDDKYEKVKMIFNSLSHSHYHKSGLSIEGNCVTGWKSSNGYIYEDPYDAPDYLEFVDIRRACSRYDSRYLELKAIHNPWWNHVTPRP